MNNSSSTLPTFVDPRVLMDRNVASQESQLPPTEKGKGVDMEGNETGEKTRNEDDEEVDNPNETAKTTTPGPAVNVKVVPVPLAESPSGTGNPSSPTNTPINNTDNNHQPHQQRQRNRDDDDSQATLSEVESDHENDDSDDSDNENDNEDEIENENQDEDKRSNGGGLDAHHEDRMDVDAPHPCPSQRTPEKEPATESSDHFVRDTSAGIDHPRQTKSETKSPSSSPSPSKKDDERPQRKEMKDDDDENAAARGLTSISSLHNNHNQHVADHHNTDDVLHGTNILLAAARLSSGINSKQQDLGHFPNDAGSDFNSKPHPHRKNTGSPFTGDADHREDEDDGDDDADRSRGSDQRAGSASNPKSIKEKTSSLPPGFKLQPYPQQRTSPAVQQRRRILPFTPAYRSQKPIVGSGNVSGTIKPKSSGKPKASSVPSSRIISPLESPRKRPRSSSTGNDAQDEPPPTDDRKIQLCSNVTSKAKATAIVVIATFDSIQKSSEATEMSHDRIRERIQEGRVLHKSFFWRYKPKPAAAGNTAADTAPSTMPKHLQPQASMDMVEYSEESESYNSEDDEEDSVPEKSFPAPTPRAPFFGTSPRHKHKAYAHDEGDDEFTPSASRRRRGGPLKRKHSYMVEQICADTDRVLQIHKSISAASKVAKMDPSLLGKRMKLGRIHAAGFYWRFADNQGRTDDASVGGESASTAPVVTTSHYRARAVEQVSMETGKVLARFESQTAASRVFGIDRVKFRRMLAVGPVKHNGSIWRNFVPNNEGEEAEQDEDDEDHYHDEDSQSDLVAPISISPRIPDALAPSPASAPAAADTATAEPIVGLNPQRTRRTIEAVNLETGRITVYYSQKEGADSIGITASYLSRLLKREPVEYKGYLWRYKSEPDDGDSARSGHSRDAGPRDKLMGTTIGGPKPSNTHTGPDNDNDEDDSLGSDDDSSSAPDAQRREDIAHRERPIYEDDSSDDDGGQNSISSNRSRQRQAKIASQLNSGGNDHDRHGFDDSSDASTDDSSLSDASEDARVHHKEHQHQHQPHRYQEHHSQPPTREKRHAGLPTRYADMTDGDDDGEENSSEDLATRRRSISRPRRRVEKVAPETNQVLQVYQSQSAACRDLGTTNQQFSSLMKQAPVLHKGYIWRFRDSGGDSDARSGSRSTENAAPAPAGAAPAAARPDALSRPAPVVRRRSRGGTLVDRCCLKTGKLLQTHESQRDACKFIGTRPSAFSELMKGAPVEHKGFLWRFSEALAPSKAIDGVDGSGPESMKESENTSADIAVQSNHATT